MYIKVDAKYSRPAKTIIFICSAIFVIFIILISAGIYMTVRSSAGPDQKEFAKHNAPKILPDGFYKGTSDLPTGGWKGKRFDNKTATGVNIVDMNGTPNEVFPFRMYKTDGIRDHGLIVLRIDYNLPENPWWIRPAMDEIVEVAPGKLLGKIHYRYTSVDSFSIGFFRQEK